jgi:uncharacterized SAM-binding protein YcdF (DUF218 family)
MSENHKTTEANQTEFDKLPEEEKKTRERVLEEMIELATEKLPEPEEDWDIVWVISGPPTDIKAESTEEEINESRERMETGLKISREVTAKRLGKDVEEVTVDDILNNGPNIYWNATDGANDNLRQRIAERLFEKRYGFPGEKIIVSTNKDIKHTGDQFNEFPRELAEANRKIVFVSDTYHIPRIVRYLLKPGYNAIPLEKVVVYPSEPRRIPADKAMSEIEKIPEYIKEGILPKEIQ